MLTTLLLAGLLDASAVAATLGPSAEPLTLDEVRLNLRQPPEQQNDRLTDLIVTAREYIEDKTGLVLTRRIVTETARELGRWIELDSWPVASVTAIRYPVGTALMPMAAGSWICSLARRPVRLVPARPGWGVERAFAAALPVEIDVLAGYATPADVPHRVKQAMHMLVAHWFANREAVETGQRAAAIEVPLGVTNIVSRLRLQRI